MAKIEVKKLNFYYGNYQALKNVNMNIEENEITSLIGPSGCGKSTFLCSINRMNDLIEIARYQPAAKNLRFFIMMINGARLLERMADLLKQNLKIILEIKEMDKNSIEYFDILVLKNIKIIENFYNKYI